MKLSNKYKNLLVALEECLCEEHCSGCGQYTCDINASYDNGFVLWSIQLFDWSGAASKKFRKLYKMLPKRFKADAERERKAFIEAVEHSACPYCNAVVWHDGTHGDLIFCDSCASEFKNEFAK